MGHVDPWVVGLVEPWLKVPHNYEAKLFDHNSQSCVEIKWSSNNINFVDSTFLCYYLQKQFISEDGTRPSGQG